MKVRTQIRAVACCLLFLCLEVALADEFPSPGVDLSTVDHGIAAGDDFFRYANERWLLTEQMPGDVSRWNAMDALRAKTERDVREIIEQVAADGPPPGSVEAQVAQFYAAYMDAATIQRHGLTPIEPYLAQIRAADTYPAVAVLLSQPARVFGSLFRVSVRPDQREPDRMRVFIGQADLSLPDREYLLGDEPRFVKLRAQLVAHVAALLRLGGYESTWSDAQAVLDLEVAFARAHWDRARARQRELIYNPMTVAQLKRFASGAPWDEILIASGLARIEHVVVLESGAVQALARVFKDTPLRAWRAYMAYRLLTTFADILPEALAAQSFRFNGQWVGGQLQQPERWQRAVRATNEALGEAVGKLYVQRMFPEQSKAAAEKLVENVREAFARRIERTAWMSRETRRKALDKLARFRVKIGYPDRWRDYSSVRVDAADPIGNRVRALEADWERQLAKLTQPTDRDEWRMTPQTVNASHNATLNEIVFPAAILQPPYFDANADAAANYGAIGAVIAHELSHGFDDQGSKSDGSGTFAPWWSASELAAFRQLTSNVEKQYASYEPLAGVRINGVLTLGENVADITGLTVAHDAYLLSLGGTSAPIIGGFTGDQRYFLAWAQIWRTLQRPEGLRQQILTDTHSPGPYRVNGVVRNIDAWYAAFGVSTRSALYLEPRDRARLFGAREAE